MEQSKITKGILIGLFYDYARIHKRPSARITFQGKWVNLYLGAGRKSFSGITTGEAYDVLKARTVYFAITCCFCHRNYVFGRTIRVWRL